jgi:hypothetical protein
MRDWLAQYRLAMFFAGGLCVVTAAVIAWSLMGSTAPVEADPFAEFDVELSEPAVSMCTTEAPMLRVPPPLAATESPLDHATWPVNSAETDVATTAAVTAHFASDVTPTAAPAKPVWLLGTIEPLEETTAPSVVPIEVRQAVGAEWFRR